MKYSELKKGDDMMNFYQGSDKYGKYTKAIVESIKVTKTGRVKIRVEKTFEGSDGEVSIRINDFSNGAIKDREIE